MYSSCRSRNLVSLIQINIENKRQTVFFSTCIKEIHGVLWYLNIMEYLKNKGLFEKMNDIIDISAENIFFYPS